MGSGEAVLMVSELGCEICREGVYNGSQPRFIIATTPTDLLYRCDACGCWWIGDSRTAHPVTPQQAGGRFPEQVTL